MAKRRSLSPEAIEKRERARANVRSIARMSHLGRCGVVDVGSRRARVGRRLGKDIGPG